MGLKIFCVFLILGVSNLGIFFYPKIDFRPERIFGPSRPGQGKLESSKFSRAGPARSKNSLEPAGLTQSQNSLGTGRIGPKIRPGQLGLKILSGRAKSLSTKNLNLFTIDVSTGYPGALVKSLSKMKLNLCSIDLSTGYPGASTRSLLKMILYLSSIDLGTGYPGASTKFQRIQAPNFSP